MNVKVRKRPIWALKHTILGYNRLKNIQLDVCEKGERLLYLIQIFGGTRIATAIRLILQYYITDLEKRPVTALTSD